MKTKKILVATTALLMASCSQNEVTDFNQGLHQTMGFDVYTGVQTTRGKETTLDALKASDAGFGFLAYQTTTDWATDKGTTAPSFLYNEHGTWKANPGSWEYTNTRFWPIDGSKITFFAYAPYESVPSTGSDKGIQLSANSQVGAPTLEFSVNTSNNWTDMVDLVVDGREAIKDQNGTTNSGKVTFKFKHILTKVADIKVKSGITLPDDTKIFVTGLKLVPGTEILQTKAMYEFENNTWVSLTPSQCFSGDQDLTSFLNIDTSINQWGYSKHSIDVSSNGSAVSLFKTDEALYFIPVNNATGTNAAGDLKLKISYDVVTKVDNTQNTTVGVDKEVSLPANTFKKGTAHVYTLIIQMNKIIIDAEVEGWDTGTDGDINV